MTSNEVKALEVGDKILFSDDEEIVSGAIIALEGDEGPLVRWADNTSCHIHFGNQNFCEKLVDNAPLV